RGVVLALGSHGAEVGNLQRFLNATSVSGGPPTQLVVDEIFGPKTVQALKDLQYETGLQVTGKLDDPSRAWFASLGFIPFVAAKYQTVLWPRRRAPNLIVIHTMENAEKPDKAEEVALWFAGKTAYPPPQASAHFCIDENSIVQCVRVT